MKHVLLCAIVFAVASGQTASVASIQTFTSESSFFAAAPPVSTENFDSYLSGQMWISPSVTFDGVNYRTDQYAQDRWAWNTQNLFNPHSRPNGLISIQGGNHQLTFGNGGYVRALGMWLGVPTVSFQIFDVIAVIECNGHETQLDFKPASNASSYIGFVSDVGIRQINVSDWPNDNNGANWSYDNVSHSHIIPEPSGILVLLFGIGPLGGVIWRRKSG